MSDDIDILKSYTKGKIIIRGDFPISKNAQYDCSISVSGKFIPQFVDETGTYPVIIPEPPLPPLSGCTDPNALNYNSLAVINDGSCTYPVLGCTDPDALNYNSLATVDSGGCIYPVLGCTDPNAFNYNPLAQKDDGSCIPKVYGCMDPNAFNYNPNANTSNGSCIPKIYGCTDPTAFNYNPNANTNNGSCIAKVYGCTDPTAFNYNPNANTNDGSCIAKVYGCTDPNALNYNPNANTDNGSCNYNYLSGNRVLVFEVCNSNAARDDNFAAYLNGYYIGNIILDRDALVGSLFIGSTNNDLFLTNANTDFLCPINLMVFHRFDFGIPIYNGTNAFSMRNIAVSNNGNFGSIGVRTYKVNNDNSLSDPIVITDLIYGGGTGESFDFTFDLNL